MATEYKLPYTGSQINEKLGKIDGLVETGEKLTNDIAVERARINTFTTLGEGSTAGDAELQDIRVGSDGVVYNNAGDAVRSQIGGLVDMLCTTETINLSQYNFAQGAMSGGVNEPSNTKRCSTYAFIPIAQGGQIIIRVDNGYKCEVDFYDSNQTYLGYDGWISSSGKITKMPNTAYIKIAVAYSTNNPITVNEAIDGIEVLYYTSNSDDLRRSCVEKDFMRFFIPHIYEKAFYVETEFNTPTLFIKFDELRVRGYADGKWISKNYTIAGIATDCNVSLVTSAKGVKNCLEIKDERGLIFDLTSQKFQLLRRTEISESDHKKIPVIFSESGDMVYCASSLMLTRMKNMDDELAAKIEKIQQSTSETANIPTYWDDAVINAENKIEQYQNNGGINTFSFGFVSDTHVTEDSDGTFAKLLRRVMDTCDIPLFLHGGDIVYGSGIISKADFISQILRHKEIFKSIEDKCLLAFGNHDSSYGITSAWDSALTDGEIYNYIFRKYQEKSGVIFGDTGRYFYKDVVAQKARYIVLDCYDYKTELNGNTVVSNNKMYTGSKIGEKQLEWLSNVALKVPDGYSVIICSHQPPYRDGDKNAIGWLGEDCIIDASIAVGIVNAYRNKSIYTYSGVISGESYSINADFTQYTGDFVCWVAGHTHKDYIFDIDGLKIVSTANCSPTQAETSAEFSPKKTIGTDTECIIDFLCVNKSTKTCNIVRLGAELEEHSDGRSFTY